MILDVHAKFLTDALEQVASNPDLIRSLLGAFAEDLEFPLAFRDLGVDAFVVDASIETSIEMLFHNGASDVTHIAVAYPRIVTTLRCRIATFGESERATVLVEEVFLLKSEPGVFVVEDGGTGVGRMRGTIGKQHLSHHDKAVYAAGVWVDTHRLEQTIRAAAFGLFGRTTVEAPHRTIFERKVLRIAIDDLSFTAEASNRRVAVQPDVFEFQFCHISKYLVTNKKCLLV